MVCNSASFLNLPLAGSETCDLSTYFKFPSFSQILRARLRLCDLMNLMNDVERDGLVETLGTNILLNIIPILRFTYTVIRIEYTPMRHVGLMSLFDVPPSNLFTYIPTGTSNFILDDEEDEEEMPDLIEEEMPDLISDEHLQVHGFKRGLCSHCPLAG
jgi:hypothetical protein